MHRCGMRKHYGYSVRSLTKAIYSLPFIGKIFFRSILLNNELPFDKDAAYERLKDKVTAKKCMSEIVEKRTGWISPSSIQSWMTVLQ